MVTDIAASTDDTRAKWAWFLALGLILIAAGIGAIALPDIATLTASRGLGVVLCVIGVAKIIEALQVKNWSGSAWQLLLGAVEVVGGILVFFNPLKGALAITLLMSIVLAVQAVLQLRLALQIRPDVGWRSLAVSGGIAILASISLVLKFRYTGFYDPGLIVGISILVGGWAYIAIALAKRRAL